MAEAKKQKKPAKGTAGLKRLFYKVEGNKIRRDAWSVISEAFKSRERVRLEVRGEEDLLALVCIALAPEGAVVAYGQPDEGAVIVRVDRGAKGRVHDILRRMVT